MRKRIVRIFPLLVIVFAIAFVVGRAAPFASPRVVAIGDIHGDFDSFLGILQRASLVDSSQHWSGRNAVFVQVGDILDRGPKARAAMDFLMDLQKQASRQGGRVIDLLGNHEAMNIYGDLRYNTPADYASYVDDKSDRRRKDAYAAYAALGAGAPRSAEDEWMKLHPLGFIEQREALGPNGKYGKWLRSLPAIAKVNDSIFLHGGLNPDLASWKVEQINDMISNEIKGFDAYQKYMVDQKLALPFFTLDEMTATAKVALNDPKSKDPERKKMLDGFLGYGTWMSVHPTGPLWFRGFAEWSDAEGAPLMKRLTDAFGVARFVVGHTPQPGNIVPRFDGRLYLIDTGMLSGMIEGGRASALEIVDGKVMSIY